MRRCHEALQWMLAVQARGIQHRDPAPTCIDDMVANWQLAIATVQAVGAIGRGPLCARRHGQAVARQRRPQPEIPADEINFAFDFLCAHLQVRAPRRIVNPLAQ